MRTAVVLLALLPLGTGMTLADTHHGYSRIFIFGASFMDSGNHFADTGETAHPPFEFIEFASYGIGGHRPTNGKTWVEVLAREMKLTEWAKPAYRDPAFGNYAYAYGRAREVGAPIGKSLTTQVTDWINNGYCTKTPMEDTLFIVDSGYADLLDILAAPDLPSTLAIMEGMAHSIAENIDTLYECGARNLLFAYLPPLEYGPIANGGLPPNQIEPLLSWTYNNFYLQPMVVQPNLGRMNFSAVDLFLFVTGIMALPEQYGFTNVTDACVTPYVLKDAFCENRDEYFFWDQLHPTKKAHALIAEYALGQLP
jgi:outer membrane lipase/esterase